MPRRRTCPPHHWIVDTPHGDESLAAKCQKCGAVREYQAWPEGSSWYTKRNSQVAAKRPKG